MNFVPKEMLLYNAITVTAYARRRSPWRQCLTESETIFSFFPFDSIFFVWTCTESITIAILNILEAKSEGDLKILEAILARKKA